MTLAIAIGPLAVVTVGLLKGAISLILTRLDLWCLTLAITGIILWIKTKDPLLALLMSIVADLVSSIPTVVKSYLKPQAESASAYSLSVMSMIVTLLTIRHWNVMSWAFPLYVLAMNLTYVTLILLPKRLRYQRSVDASGRGAALVQRLDRMARQLAEHHVAPGSGSDKSKPHASHMYSLDHSSGCQR